MIRGIGAVASNRRRDFSPTSLSGLKLYLNADVGVTQSGTVSQWNDLSGEGNHLAQATSGNRPSFSATGMGGSRAGILGAAGKYLNRATLTGGTIAQPVTVYGVAKVSAPGGGAALIESPNANRTLLYLESDGRVSGYAGSYVSAGTAPTVGVSAIFRAKFNGASGSLYCKPHGGTVVNSTGLNMGSFSFASGVIVGLTGALVAPWNAYYGMFLVFSRILSSPEETELEAWIANYYSIT